MPKYYKVDQVKRLIQEHAKNVGTENEIYQLAHDHILQLLDEHADVVEVPDNTAVSVLDGEVVKIIGVGI